MPSSVSRGVEKLHRSTHKCSLFTPCGPSCFDKAPMRLQLFILIWPYCIQIAALMLSTDPRDVPRATAASDIWMLGQVVYEMMTGQSYWPASLKDTGVLQTLSSPSRALPHEERPVKHPVQVSSIFCASQAVSSCYSWSCYCHIHITNFHILIAYSSGKSVVVLQRFRKECWKRF